jgi:hypothetical protein
VSVGTGHAAVRADPKPDGPRQGKKWKVALLGLVGVFVALACYDLIAVSGQVGSTGTVSAAGTVTPTAKVAPSAGAATAAGPAPSGSSTPASRALTVTSVVAFGPAGTANGDNPGIVSRILAAGTDQPWYSQWYATPEFGNLQSGTGLLLDMGETVTVTDVRLLLGSAPGANVQLRVGNSPSVDLPSVASAWGAGGAVQLTATTPAKGRYVLIWFTRLPPDGQGHYQVRVYNATVDGAAGA